LANRFVRLRLDIEPRRFSRGGHSIDLRFFHLVCHLQYEFQRHVVRANSPIPFRDKRHSQAAGFVRLNGSCFEGWSGRLRTDTEGKHHGQEVLPHHLFNLPKASQYGR
jgi:hypothetical protein